jgi:ribosome biogenesis protein SSF1/2
LRKERREEQDRNVQRKKALAGKTKADAVSATGEEGTDEGDDDDDEGSLEAPSEKLDGGEASWDEEEEISEGEVSEDDDARSEDQSSEDEDDDRPPRKKRQK